MENGRDLDPAELQGRTVVVRRARPGVQLRPLSLNPYAAPIPVASALIFRRPDRPPQRPLFGLMAYDSDGDWLMTMGADSLQIALDHAQNTLGIESDAWDRVLRPLVDAPVISDDLLHQLRRVPPSTDLQLTYRPCRVRLSDGTWRERVYVQDVETIDGGGTWSSGGDRLDFSTIVEIQDSSQRLSPPIADALYAAGESAMGGCYFALRTRSGRRVLYQTGNLVDFVALPSGVLPADIANVEPHADDARTAEQPLGTLDSEWSLYALPA